MGSPHEHVLRILEGRVGDPRGGPSVGWKSNSGHRGGVHQKGRGLFRLDFETSGVD